MRGLSPRKIVIILILCATCTYAFGVDKKADSKEPAPIKHNPWSLIIYRPENAGDMNDVRCWLKIENPETGEDITYNTTKIKASYEWTANTIKEPQLYRYKRTYYLSGGMAMHLNLRPGKYKFTVYTPKDKTNMLETSNQGDWISNEFLYDTENPTKVIWVVPTANDNGFYNGGWYIDYKAPEWYKFTKPKIE